MKKNELQQSKNPPSATKEGSDKLPQNELADDELDKVSGGKVHLQDFHFVKKTDKASA